MTNRTYAEVTSDLAASSQSIWHMSEQLSMLVERDLLTDCQTIEQLDMALEAEEDRHEALSHERAIICARMAA